jgi:hypothetical protein
MLTKQFRELNRQAQVIENHKNTVNKQETLEEVTKIFKNDRVIHGNDITYENGFIDATKWQQERMYSEKEVESLLHKFMQSQHPDWHGYSTTKWFEQYKKK